MLGAIQGYHSLDRARPLRQVAVAAGEVVLGIAAGWGCAECFEEIHPALEALEAALRSVVAQGPLSVMDRLICAKFPSSSSR